MNANMGSMDQTELKQLKIGSELVNRITDIINTYEEAEIPTVFRVAFSVMVNVLVSVAKHDRESLSGEDLAERLAALSAMALMSSAHMAHISAMLMEPDGKALEEHLVRMAGESMGQVGPVH